MNAIYDSIFKTLVHHLKTQIQNDKALIVKIEKFIDEYFNDYISGQFRVVFGKFEDNIDIIFVDKSKGQIIYLSYKL